MVSKQRLSQVRVPPGKAFPYLYLQPNLLSIKTKIT
jgi:hypothetical protein